MLVTLALVVFFGSIMVFFSDEFSNAIKKLFAIKGAKLLLPLFFASWVIYTFDFWFLWIIFYLREMLHELLASMVSIIPFQRGAESLTLIFLLSVLSIAPVLILDILSRRKHYKGYQHPYIMSGFIWIISVVLLIIL